MKMNFKRPASVHVDVEAIKSQQLASAAPAPAAPAPSAVFNTIFTERLVSSTCPRAHHVHIQSLLYYHFLPANFE